MIDSDLFTKRPIYSPGSTGGGFIYANWNHADVNAGDTADITYSTSDSVKMTCLSFCYYLSGKDVSSSSV